MQILQIHLHVQDTQLYFIGEIHIRKRHLAGKRRVFGKCQFATRTSALVFFHLIQPKKKEHKWFRAHCRVKSLAIGWLAAQNEYFKKSFSVWLRNVHAFFHLRITKG